LVLDDQPAAGTARDFGPIQIGLAPSGWVNILVWNRTPDPILTRMPVIGGPDVSHFQLDVSGGTSNGWVSATETIAAGNFRLFSVRFRPYELGIKDCWVDVEIVNDYTHRVHYTGEGAGDPPGIRCHEHHYNGPPVYDGDPAANDRDFGMVAANSSSQWLIIVIWNRQTTDTTITVLPYLSGPDSGEFYIDTSGMVTLLQGSTNFADVGQLTYFSILFAPTSPGVKQATVTFEHNAQQPDPGTYSFGVEGTGIPPGPAIVLHESDPQANPVPGGNIANGDTPAMGRIFPDTTVNLAPSPTLWIRISNPGSQDLILGTPLLVAAHASDFKFVLTHFSNTVPHSVPQNFTRLGIYFEPTAPGRRNATVSISHNAMAFTPSPFIFDVTGLAWPDAPLFRVYEPVDVEIPHNSAAAGTPRDLGYFPVAGISPPEVTITIRNPGPQTMTVQPPRLVEGDTTDFALIGMSNPSGTNLPPFNGIATFRVQLSPQTQGPLSVMIELEHNGWYEHLAEGIGRPNPFRFEVAAFVVASGPWPQVRESDDTGAAGPHIVHGTAAEGGRDFGAWEPGETSDAPLYVRVMNVGDAQLTLGDPYLDGPHADDFTLDLTGFAGSLATGEYALFKVEFTPGGGGPRHATLRIPHNGTGVADPFVFELTGTGLLPPEGDKKKDDEGRCTAGRGAGGPVLLLMCLLAAALWMANRKARSPVGSVPAR
jgi:hypothetical protein